MPAAGNITLDATAARLTRSSITWINAQAGCQYFNADNHDGGTDDNRWLGRHDCHHGRRAT